MRSTYAIRECFYSLQGEGIRAGEPSVFLRFAGCNLNCTLATHGFDCDTDFAHGEKLSAREVVKLVKRVRRGRCDWVVLTGGEPALQVTPQLIDALRDAGFKLAIETNGTRELPAGLDWICVSPKVPEHELKQLGADEVKYVVGHGDPIPTPVINARHYLLSPAFSAEDKVDPMKPGAPLDRAVEWAIGLCLENPRWRLSMQQHKFWRVR